MKKGILLLFIITYHFAIAQSVEIKGKDTINYTDDFGKKQGKWILLNKFLKKPNYEDNQKVEEGKYIDSKKTGLWKEYYPNSTIKSIITYENNRPYGYAKMYNDNGKIKEEGLWKNNRWIGDYKLYYDNGQVQQAFNFNTSGKRVGQQIYYYDNGQVMIEGKWDDGKETGILKEYYENGDLKSEKFFNGGNIDSTATKNYNPTKPIVEIKEKKIYEAPITVEKNEKDNLGKVFNGEGYWKLYNSNKQISKDGIFSKNRLISGKVYHYSPDGILLRIAAYKEGKYIGDNIIEE